MYASMVMCQYNKRFSQLKPLGNEYPGKIADKIFLNVCFLCKLQIIAVAIKLLWLSFKLV